MIQREVFINEYRVASATEIGYLRYMLYIDRFIRDDFSRDSVTHAQPIM